ncbi:MAG TPA: sigma-70 family RNA polymerase sigma factor, partial [Vicinamibacterales bacterium]|nr:sigma-70 family RNA polymerase sigma factor [Vicinamibacterales bacterium]
DAAADRIGRLYDRFAGVLYRHALMILADPAGAADAVHQVFVGLLGGAGGAMDDEERYLRRSVRNACYTALRQRRPNVLSASDAPLLEAVAAGRDRPDERIAIEQAMRALPAEQREVVHLKVFEGWTFQEIADFGGESINTVASRYRYAMDKMRERLS